MIKIRTTEGVYILAAAALLLLPLRWFIGAAFAAVFHELCHYSALRLSDVQVFGLRVGTGGAVMETGPMDRRQEFLCALAGPLGSFALVLLHRWFPVAAVCAGVQGLYNLLPLDTLDGGRMFRCVFGDRNLRIAEKCVLMLLALAGLYGFFCLKLGFGALLVVILLIQRSAARKTPCKDGRLGVQ